MGSVHTTEYYSALNKRRKILTPATLRMNHEDFMPSEITEAHSNQSCVIPSIRGPERGHIHRDRKGNGEGVAEEEGGTRS